MKKKQRLCIGKSLKQIKFWGKIIGSKKDYFVAEGISEEAGDQGELPPNVELKGSGVNKLNYWVTNDSNFLNNFRFFTISYSVSVIFGDWIELPLLIPEQLISARKIKYMFSGDLERDVIINPYFFGKEKHLVIIF